MVTRWWHIDILQSYRLKKNLEYGIKSVITLSENHYVDCNDELVSDCLVHGTTHTCLPCCGPSYDSPAVATAVMGEYLMASGKVGDFLLCQQRTHLQAFLSPLILCNNIVRHSLWKSYGYHNSWQNLVIVCMSYSVDMVITIFSCLHDVNCWCMNNSLQFLLTFSGIFINQG